MYRRHETGRVGEEVACDYVKKLGYEIIEKNYRNKMGEIDIIAKDKNEIVFIEVKTRCQKIYGSPSEAVDRRKKRHIYHVAEFYLIINKLTLEKYARISSILYSIYISSIINSSVLTNQNLATLLFYLALYILIINIKHKWILVGITLGLGNIIRPEAPIILIAIFLFLIFRDFTDFRIIKRNILSFIGILFTFIIITKGASFLILKSGYTEYHLSNRDPLWKITCGLNPDTKGTYSHDDLVFLSQFEDRNEGHKTLITTRLDNPVSLLVTMASKTVPMWASNDTSISFAFSDNIDNTNLYNALLKLEKIQYIIIITFALLGVINMIREKSKFNYSFLFLIILIGYFLAHLILEVQPRYRYFAIPIFFIMAAYGFTKSKLTYKFLKE